MIQTILVPLDGSALAEQALPEARRLAAESAATIVLMRAVQADTILADPLKAQVDRVKEAEEYLAQVEARLTAAGFVARSEVYYDSPVEAILLAATLVQADIVVMSTHGRTGLFRAVLGSVAEHVIQQATVPLLLVRAHRTPQVKRDGHYRTILVPLDRTALAESALRYVAAEPFARRAEIILVHSEQTSPVAVAPGVVGYVPEGIYTQIEQQEEQQRSKAREYLDAVAATVLLGQSWQSYVSIGEPASTILHLAQDEDADLIAMATHGRAGFDRLLHGSVAAQVLHHTDVPLLLLHGADTVPEQSSRPDAAWC